MAPQRQHVAHSKTMHHPTTVFPILSQIATTGTGPSPHKQPAKFPASQHEKQQRFDHHPENVSKV
jgi:hypothetical protein